MKHIIRTLNLFIFITALALGLPHLQAGKDDPENTSTRPKYKLHGVALFTGSDPFSLGIRLVTKSKISHCGIILRDKTVAPENEEGWYCFEAVGTAQEVLEKQVMPHVRVTPWQKVIKTYDGRQIARRLFEFQEGASPSSKNVTEFVKKFDGMAYEKNFLELLKAVNASNKEKNISSVFCSELVAEMLMELGLLEHANSNNFIPKQFSTEKDVSLKLINAQLSEQVVVKKNKMRL